MAFQFSFRKNRPIYFIIKDYVLRAIEIKSTNPLIVNDFHERYIPAGIVKDGKIIDEEMFLLILEECLTEWKIGKRKVMFHVPDSFVIIRKVTVPAELLNDEIYGHLYMEIGATIHLPFEQPVFDYHVVAKTEEGKELILFAAPEETVITIAELFEEVKLNAVAADISALSLYRLYDKIFPRHDEEQLMIIQADLHAVNVCIFENEHPVFMRNIPIDADHEKWSPASLSGSDIQLTYDGEPEDVGFALEDIYTEISRVVDFYRYTLNHGAKQITKLLVTGDHPWLNTIQEQIHDRVQIEMETIPQEAVKTASKADPLPASFHCAVGLGLKGV